MFNTFHYFFFIFLSFSLSVNQLMGGGGLDSYSTVCPRSPVHFYIVSCYMILEKPSWTASSNFFSINNKISQAANFDVVFVNLPVLEVVGEIHYADLNRDIFKGLVTDVGGPRDRLQENGLLKAFFICPLPVAANVDLTVLRIGL